MNDGVVLRPDNPLAFDLRVCLALLNGSDTQQVLDTLFSPNYSVTTSVVATTDAGYVDLLERLKYDSVLANKLLDEACWKKAVMG